MANDKSCPPIPGPDKSCQALPCPVRFCHVPSGPSKCPVRSQRMSRQVPNVPSGPSQCPVNSLLNTFPGPDANSVKFCQERSHKSVDVARVGPAVVALLRSHRKAGRQTPIVLSRFCHFLVCLLWHWRHGPPEKISRMPRHEAGGAKTVRLVCLSVSVPPVRLLVCPLSVCQCASCPSVSHIVTAITDGQLPSSGRGVTKAAGTKNGNSLGTAT